MLIFQITVMVECTISSFLFLNVLLEVAFLNRNLVLVFGIKNHSSDYYKIKIQYNLTHSYPHNAFSLDKAHI